MITNTPQFPQYGIYGIPATDAPVSYFHFENARDIAISHNWDFKPHVHTYLYQMIWVKRGKGVFSAEGKRTQFNGNWVVFIAPNTLHSVSFAENSQIWSLYFNHDFMNLGHMGNMLKDFMGNISRPMCMYVDIPPTHQQLWHDLFTHIKQEVTMPHALGHNACIKSWVALLLTQLIRIENAKKTANNKNISTPQAERAEKTTNAFLQLLEQHYQNQHRIDFYTQSLYISPDTLNNHIRAVLGRTLAQVIRDRIVLEAKRQLLYADKSVSQVAEILHFDDTSYFVRFFKRETGMTPKIYKKQQGINGQTGHYI